MADFGITEEQIALETSGQLTLNATLSMSISFGVTPSGEFYIDSSDDSLQMALTAMGTVDTSGRLGFVEVTADGVEIDLAVTYDLDLIDPSGEGQVTSTELGALCHRLKQHLLHKPVQLNLK